MLAAAGTRQLMRLMVQRATAPVKCGAATHPVNPHPRSVEARNHPHRSARASRAALLLAARPFCYQLEGLESSRQSTRQPLPLAFLTSSTTSLPLMICPRRIVAPG